jgi:hypothetical protein
MEKRSYFKMSEIQYYRFILIKALFILSAGMLALPMYVNATSSEIPYCNAEQLGIHQIATDYPGMMHSKTLYAVINTSPKSCHLNGTPAVWGISKQDKIYLSKEAQQNSQSVLVEPASKNYIYSDKLVWFSIEGHGDVKSPFKTIQITLPGIAIS